MYRKEHGREPADQNRVTGLFVNGVEDRRADGRSAGRVASKCKSSAHWPAERGAAGHAAARRVLLLHLHRAVANTSTSPWRGWRERAGAAALEHPVVFERTASTAVVGYRINWHASARLCAALCATRCRLPAEVCGIAAFTPPSAPALPWQLPPSHHQRVLRASDVHSDNRCRACNKVGECVALRPCGHAVLCRPCSDFVFECPLCGQYISGISTEILPDNDVSRWDNKDEPIRW